ncbi:MAG: hypothetical protein L0287_24220, partial [Anaerolineae bacterium]|nr:hypothetical protein [Anaerolineae bacterium]
PASILAAPGKAFRAFCQTMTLMNLMTLMNGSALTTRPNMATAMFAAHSQRVWTPLISRTSTTPILACVQDVPTKTKAEMEMIDFEDDDYVWDAYSFRLP